MKRAWRPALLFFVAAAGAASAANLDKAQCDALRAEEALLVAAGVKADMGKGPEWAKANLAPERITQIKQFIEVGEQIAFRCGPLPAPVEAKAPGAQPAKGKGPRPSAQAKAAAAGAADVEGAASAITGGHLPPPDTGEPPKKPKAAKRSTKRKTAAGAAAKAKAATAE